MAECLTNLGDGSALEEKLRHTHVILEAFGNAKISKDANSSQFLTMSNLTPEAFLLKDKVTKSNSKLTYTH
ncbi:hypothetical protein Syun_014079 [Stephania yunnanensis]|uniref:Uncharacterized protein n=1 Tax=Stephania yunnanensis TaxID=152371 RepID=A0AAP0JJ27_9MAGN